MSNNTPLKIVQVSIADIAGGAEKVAYSLHQIYRDMGYESKLIVGQKFSDDPDVLTIDNTNRGKGFGKLKLFFEQRFGWQYLDFPGSHRIPELLGESWDILHIHNLHHDYFDLAALPRLSRIAPTILMLHDCWFFTGHCAHPFDCERWRVGCGRCPDFSINPAISADGTHFNWRRKRKLLQASRLWITAPSKWLLEKTKKSFLRNFPLRLTYNGVNHTIFNPGSKVQARAKLELPADRKIILFSANGGLRNPWKDCYTLLQAVKVLIHSLPEVQRPLLVALGARQETENIDNVKNYILFRPFVSDEETIAEYYRAADVLAYATKADNCPLTVLEAMACGLPVVASAVGGIPELIEDGNTGFVVGPGDAGAFGEALKMCLTDPTLAQHMSQSCVEIARHRFDIQRQANEYLAWYYELIAKTEHQTSSTKCSRPSTVLG